jgi:ABC-type multidrug transport system fused ATPase/permease subunit
MKRVLGYLKGYKLESILGPLFKLLEASFELMVPLVVASIIDIGIRNMDRQYIISRGAILVILGLIGLTCAATAQFFAAKAAVGFGTKLRQALFDHLQNLSVAAYDRIGASTLITRITSDVNQVQTGVNMVLRLFLRAPVIVIGAMVMAFTIDVKAALIFVVLIPLLSIVVGVILRIGIPLFAWIQGRLEGVMKRARENLTGVRVLRAFRREQDEEMHFASESDGLMKLQIFTGRITGLLNPLTLVMVNVFVIILLYHGSGRVAAGVLTLGAVVALVNYMSQILIELIKVANLIITITRSFASGQRLAAVFALEEDQECQGDGYLCHSERSEESILPFITFQKVSFKYPGTAENALHDISFTVKKGETIGIIGGTGAGKSTLVNLLPRFYDTDNGTIIFAGRDLRDISPAEARANIGMVMQKAVLFKGTIRDNLKWGKEDVTDADIWEALRIAQAEEFVRDKEGGLDALVEQEGRNFSGGQKQRLTIARALVRKPPILIFDDSTSELDYMTESAFRQELKNISWPVTTFIISQRAGSVRHADQIIVLEEGQMIGCGKHEELVEACEVYKEIYEVCL